MSRSPQSDLRVMHVTEAAAGGVRRHLGYIVPALAAIGVQQSVVISLRRAEAGLEDDLAAWAELGCAIHLLPMRHGLAMRDLADVKTLRRLVRRDVPHVVHAHATKAGLLARLAAPRDVPVAYSPHSFFFQELRGAKRRLAVALEQLLARRTARFILVSQAERELAKTCLGLPPERLRVVENGLPASWSSGLLPRSRVREAWGIEEPTCVLLVPARLARQKGHPWLFQALARLGTDGPRIQIRLLGEGPELEHLRALADQLAISPLLHWSGYVPDAGRQLAGADLVVLPSCHEGLSYTLLEALAAGTPLLVSDIPGNVPHASIRRALTTVPLDDVPALTAALHDFLADSTSWQRRAATGPDLVRLHWSLPRQAEALLACYRELATTPATGRCE